MSKQYVYQVTQARFYNNVLYKPGERDRIVSDKPIKGAGLVLLNEHAEAVRQRQSAKTREKQEQVAESNKELKTIAAATGNVPDFSGKSAKTSRVVTL